MDSLSIVIPTILSDEALLQESLRSVFSQSRKPGEIIVFLNGKSPPDWLNKLKREAESFSLYHCDDLLAPTTSWTTACSFATKEYIFILGDDDTLDIAFVEIASKLIDNQNLISFQPQFINSTSHVIGQSSCLYGGFRTPNQLLYDRYINRMDILVPGLLFKKSLFEAVGGYINTGLPVCLYADDLIFFAMAHANGGALVFKDHFLWSYRKHSGSLSYSNSFKSTTSLIISLAEKIIHYAYAGQHYTTVYSASVNSMRSLVHKRMITNAANRYFQKQSRTFGLFQYIFSFYEFTTDFIPSNSIRFSQKTLILAKAFMIWLKYVRI